MISLVLLLTLSQAPGRTLQLGPSPLKGGAWAVEVKVYGLGKLKPGQAKPAADDNSASRELTERFVIHMQAVKLSTTPETLRLTRKGVTTPWKPTLRVQCETQETGAFDCLAQASVLVEGKDGTFTVTDGWVRHSRFRSGNGPPPTSDLALGFMRNSIDSLARDFISEVKQANDDG